MVLHFFGSSTWKAEASRFTCELKDTLVYTFQATGQPKVHSETLSLNKTK